MKIPPPSAPLTDATVTLRIPSAAAGDTQAIARYVAAEGQLEGCWLPLLPGASADDTIDDWLEGWSGRPARNGPALVVTISETPDFIGVVSFMELPDSIVEMTYGIAPRWRGQGYASRAARLGARWAAALPGVDVVELRIAQDAHASRHVAHNAGFRPAGTVSQFVPGTGETYQDLRYILDRSHQPILGLEDIEAEKAVARRPVESPHEGP